MKRATLYRGRFLDLDSLAAYGQGQCIGYTVTQELSGVALWRAIWGASEVFERFFEGEFSRDEAIETAVRLTDAARAEYKRREASAAMRRATQTAPRDFAVML